MLILSVPVTLTSSTFLKEILLPWRRFAAVWRLLLTFRCFVYYVSYDVSFVTYYTSVENVDNYVDKFVWIMWKVWIVWINSFRKILFTMLTIDTHF